MTLLQVTDLTVSFRQDGQDIPAVKGVSFDVGVRQMGGQTMVLSGNDMQLGHGETIADTGCSLKAYRRWVVRSLHLYSDMHRFMAALGAGIGARITELPVRHHARHHGTSKYGLGRIFRVLADLEPQAPAPPVVAVDVAVADRAPRTMAMGMIQMIRNAVVTRSSRSG